MHVKTLDLNLLRVFDAVMMELNVSRAAEKLFMSQPAVSHALSRLRHAAKDELFIKVPGGVKATPRAQELAPAIHHALQSLERAFNPDNFDPATSAQIFRIATHDYMVTVMMAKLASYVAQQAPNISIRVKPTGGRALEMLDSQEADMAMSAFGELPERFDSLALFSDDYVCMMNKSHPLAQKPFTLEEFASARHLLISPRGDERGFVDTILASHGMTRHVALIINQFSPAASILAESDLILTVTRRIADMYAEPFNLHVCPCPIEAPETFTRTQVVWHSRLGKHPAFQWLQETLGNIMN